MQSTGRHTCRRMCRMPDRGGAREADDAEKRERQHSVCERAKFSHLDTVLPARRRRDGARAPLTLELRDAPVAELVSRCVSSLEAEARARDVELQARVFTNPLVRVAPDKVERVLLNLLT